MKIYMLKHIILFLIIISCVKPDIKVDFIHYSGVLTNIDEIILFNGINEFRGDFLLLDANFNKAASDRVEFLKNNLPISHNGIGITIAFLDSLGVNGSAEALAYGYRHSESVIIAWDNSESHSRVLHAEKWKYLGLSVGEDEEGNKIYCTIFGY